MSRKHWLRWVVRFDGFVGRSFWSDRVLIARVDYLAADEGEDYEWGPERVVWPEERAGPFSPWPEWPRTG